MEERHLYKERHIKKGLYTEKEVYRGELTQEKINTERDVHKIDIHRERRI